MAEMSTMIAESTVAQIAERLSVNAPEKAWVVFCPEEVL